MNDFENTLTAVEERDARRMAEFNSLLRQEWRVWIRPEKGDVIVHTGKVPSEGEIVAVCSDGQTAKAISMLPKFIDALDSADYLMWMAEKYADGGQCERENYNDNAPIVAAAMAMLKALRSGK